MFCSGRFQDFPRTQPTRSSPPACQAQLRGRGASAAARDVTGRRDGASSGQLCPATGPGCTQESSNLALLKRLTRTTRPGGVRRPRNASFHLPQDQTVPHGSRVIWGNPRVCGQALGVQGKAERNEAERNKRPPPARHPANPTLPRIRRAAPWLPTREGIEPGPGFLVPASAGKQPPAGWGGRQAPLPGTAPCHLAAGPHRCHRHCPGSASHGASSRGSEEFWGWGRAAGPSGGLKDEELLFRRRAQSHTKLLFQEAAEEDKIAWSLSTDKALSPPPAKPREKRLPIYPAISPGEPTDS